MNLFKHFKKFKWLYASAMAFLAVSLVGLSVCSGSVFPASPEAVSVASGPVIDVPKPKGLSDSGFVPAGYPYSVSYVYLPERFRPISGNSFYVDLNKVQSFQLQTYRDEGEEVNYDYGYFGERVFTLDLSRMNVDAIEAWTLALRYDNHWYYLNQEYFNVSSPLYSVSNCLSDRVVYFGGAVSDDSDPLDYLQGVYEASAKYKFGEIGYHAQTTVFSFSGYWFGGVLSRLFSSANYTNPFGLVFTPVQLSGLSWSGIWRFDGGVYNYMEVEVTSVTGNTVKYASADDLANMPLVQNYPANLFSDAFESWHIHLPTMPDTFVSRVYFYGEAGEFDFYRVDLTTLNGKQVYVNKVFESFDLPTLIDVVASNSSTLVSTSAHPNFYDLFVGPFSVVNNVSDAFNPDFTFVRYIPFVGVRDYSDTGEAFLSVFELFSMAFKAFAGLFSMSVAGGLTFGVLLFLPMVVLIMITLVRLLRG